MAVLTLYHLALNLIVRRLDSYNTGLARERLLEEDFLMWTPTLSRKPLYPSLAYSAQFLLNCEGQAFSECWQTQDIVVPDNHLSWLSYYRIVA